MVKFNKVRILIQAYINTKDKKFLLKKICKILKKYGIKGLKERIVNASNKSKNDSSCEDEKFENHIFEIAPIDSNGVKALFISYDLSMTGVPVALFNAANALNESGGFSVVLSYLDGNLRSTIEQNGIPVIVDKRIGNEKFWIDFAAQFDIVVVNSCAAYFAVAILGSTELPILWWLHESDEYFYMYADDILPQRIHRSIKIYCGGGYSQKVVNKYRNEYETNVLLYGVPDLLDNNTNFKKIIDSQDDEIIVLTVGTIEKRKGQDILAQSIESMPLEYIQKCKFVFVGRIVDHQVGEAVRKIERQYAVNVCVIEEVDRETMKHIYMQSSIVVCSSRDDPMPIFMTEAMMFSKVCICSEYTGTASLISDGENGFVYKNNSSKELMDKLILVIDSIRDLDNLRAKGRKTYEENFSMKMFKDNFIKAINDTIDQN